MKKKNILFVIDSLSSGGAEKSLVTVLSLLDPAKYDISLLAFKNEGLYTNLVPNYIKRIESTEYHNYLNKKQTKKISFIKRIKFISSKFLVTFFLKLGNILLKIYPNLKIHPAQTNWRFNNFCFDQLSNNYDVAIAYSQGLPTYFVSKKVKAKKKICWINTDYDKAKYSKKYDEKFYKTYDNIITVSEKSSDVFIKLFPFFKSKTNIIYDILSETLIKKMSTQHGGYNDDFNGIRILTIGRIVHLKGYDFAIEAAERLRKDNINFKWYAIGEGHLKNEFIKAIHKKKIQDHFVFIGTYTNPYPFLKNCDIYCQPSRFEGYGLAIAEARVFSKPIIATNFETIHNQLKHGENGLIAQMNGNSIYQAIKKIINDKALEEKIIANLKKEVIDNESELLKIEKLLDNKANL